MAARGYALHIGLNSVDPAHYGGWPGDLAACEADSEDMQHIGKSQNFESVRLVTKDATRAKVRAAIENAASTLKSGDIFLLTYSGHGGQVPDIDDEEPDGLDETWCLYDGQLLDDELGALWTKFAPEARIFVLSDSCHSGSATRAFLAIASNDGARALVAPDAAATGTPPRPRALPTDVALRTYRQNRAFYDKLQGGPSSDESAKETRATVRLISGCQDNQVSLDGAFNGLFTGTLLRVWKEGAFQGAYADFHKEIVKRMPPTQTPNHYVIGASNAAFDAQRPFVV